jgi:hypothetical protein
MLRRLRGGLTYSNVMATVAVMIALGGTAAAAVIITDNSQVGDNTINSRNIVDASLATNDLKAAAVTAAKLAANAVTSPKVVDNSLTGTDIDESTLGTVPTASTAFTVPDSSIYSAKVVDNSLTAADTAPIEHWHYIGNPGEPAFQNGWVNYDAATSHSAAQWQHVAYAKDNDDIVHLEGLLKGGTMGATMFTLPAAYCPWYYQLFPVLSNNALGRVTITWVSGSSCNVYADVGSNVWISLDGITLKPYQQDQVESFAAAKTMRAREQQHPVPGPLTP